MTNPTNDGTCRTASIALEPGTHVRLIDKNHNTIETYEIKSITDTGLVRLLESSTLTESTMGLAEFKQAMWDANSFELWKP